MHKASSAVSTVAARQAIHNLSRRQRGPARRRLLLEWLESRQLLSTFSVLNTNDSGEGSLRQAMLDANANAGADLIDFNIPGSGVHTIQPLSPLPSLTSPVTIDGYTQPGASVNTLASGDNAVLQIELDGSSAGGAYGLHLTAGNSTVRGLAINRFAYVGIRLENAGGNRVTGNFIGTDVTGTLARGNGIHGIGLYLSNDNVIGTNADGIDDLAERNVVAAGNVGIFVQYSHHNVVAGNYVGTDKNGTIALQNSEGIWVLDGVSNTIGGTTTAARNLVSGNLYYGIHVQGNGAQYTGDSGADNNVVQGNFVGTDVSGMSALPNGGFGMLINSNRNTVGGSTTGARNLVSGNGTGVGGDGIQVIGHANTVQGNYVGTDVTGTLSIGNTGLTYAMQGNGISVQGTNNMIGGAATGEGNLVANNAGVGILVTYAGVNVAGASTTGNTVRGNSIFANGRLGIDLENLFPGGGGVTANDAGDSDSGPNDLQNFPLVTAAVRTPGGTSVSGSLNGTPSSTFTLDFYSNASIDPSGYGEGRTYLGSATVATDINGDVTFNVSVAGIALVGQFVSATATDSAGSTSEFSGNTVVTAGCVEVPSLIVTTTSDVVALDCETSLREAINYANSLVGHDTITFSIPGSGVHTIQPTSSLPNINSPLTINGYSQPGSSANTLASGNDAVLKIELDGSLVGGSGLILVADGNTIRGLAINNFAGAGIFSYYSDNNVIAGNFIGTDATGTFARPNDLGVKILAAQDNIVGGTSPADRNLLSGNKYDGINVQGTYNPTQWLATGNQIIGNFAGTDASGTVALPNGSGGFDGYGINVGGGSGNLIANNLVSGNGDGGIALGDYNTIVRGNLVGTDVTGTLPLGNTGNLYYPQFGNGIGVYGVGNQIGGAGVGEANVIAFNDGAGIYVSDVASYVFVDHSAVTIRGNAIFSNGGLGIDLAPAVVGARGVTVNDVGDADVGPNGYQNFPLLSAAHAVAGGTFVSGSLNSSANATFTLDFYANSVADPSGFGEGATYLGSTTVTTDGAGNATFAVTVPGVAAIGALVSATATHATAGTSEFSGDRAITTFVPATISGAKFNDLDGDGARDIGEPGIANWTIALDVGADGSVESTVTTDGNGNYSIDNLPPGTYRIREVQQAGWSQTTTNPADIIVSASEQSVANVDFGNHQDDATTLITGRKFFDVDSDGVADLGEPGLRYWPIYIDANTNGSYDSGEPITWTGWNGEYSFAGVAQGTYRVREIQQPGWTQTTTNPADVMVTTNGQTFENIDFGNQGSDGPGPGINPPTDLEIVKGAIRAVAGEQIIYTLTVTNRGPADSYGVILGDQLKPGLVFESATPSQGTCRGGQTVVCAVGSLEVGESASVTIVAHVQSWVVDEIENESCVYSSATDTDSSDNCSIVRTPIDTRTDLELVKTADGLRAIAGRDLTYTLRVTNHGPSDSTNVELEDELPPEVTFVSANSTHGTCALEVTSVETVICELGTVANGETAVVTLVVHVGPWVPEDAIITNTARVHDPHGGSGTGVIRIPCGRSTDFELIKTGPYTTVDAQVYYVLEVTNHGPSNSAGPIVGDDLPDDINFLYAVPSQGWCNQLDPLLCNLGPMVVGQVETVTVFVGVPETVVIGDVRNEAVVQPPEGDPNPENNWGGTGGGIRPNYGLGITKEAPPEIPAGDYLTYTLEVTNEGPDDASNVIVGDTIPAGLIFVSATPTQGSCNSLFNPILCFLGPMEMGDVAEVEIVVFVPPSIPEGTIFTNRGYGWGGVPPVFDDATTRVIHRSDISLVKEAPEEVIAGTEMTYTLRTRNRGPSDSTNITLEDVLPPEVVFVSATPTQGACTDSEDMGQTTVSCALGDIPAGGVATVEITVFVPSDIVEGSIITNGACVAASVIDFDPTNNCDEVETGVGESPDLEVIKTSTPGPITAGENIEYTLEVHNKGPSDTRHVVLGDTLPAGVVFVSATSTQGTCEYLSGIVRCDVGYIAVGQHEFVTIVAFVPPTTPDGTVIENTGCIIECGHDPFPDNDCSTVRNTIRAESILTGVKFNDLDGDGVRDAGEPGIEGWQIFLDLDGDNQLDPGERSTFTDASGVYTFAGVGKATWFVREVQNPDWVQTTPNPAGVTVTGLQLTYFGGDFGNFRKVTVGGRVYHDYDRNAIRDPGEPGLGGWIIIIDLNNNGVLDPGEQSTITDPNGDYRFRDLGPGVYPVRELVPPGWTPTTPNPVPITPRSGVNPDPVDFGNSRAGTPAKITGGGSIDQSVRNFGFVVMPKAQGGSTTFFGNLEFQDKSLGYNLKATTITSINVEPDRIHGQFTGTATLNGVAGYRFYVELEDRAEPGALIDKFRIRITGPSGFSYDSNTYATRGGVLDKGGNIQIHKAGSALVAGGAAEQNLGTSSSDQEPGSLILSAGQLRAGVLTVSVDDRSTTVTAAQQARMDAAIASLNESLTSFGVVLTAAGAADVAADIRLSLAADSDCGDATDGVLGCTDASGDIVILTGWDWYAGTDASAVAADQFDFQTVVTHEFGHSLGLGHSADAQSVMYQSLASGQARRTLTAHDLIWSEELEAPRTTEALVAGPPPRRSSSALPFATFEPASRASLPVRSESPGEVSTPGNHSLRSGPRDNLCVVGLDRAPHEVRNDSHASSNEVARSRKLTDHEAALEELLASWESAR